MRASESRTTPRRIGLILRGARAKFWAMDAICLSTSNTKTLPKERFTPKNCWRRNQCFLSRSCSEIPTSPTVSPIITATAAQDTKL